MPPANASAAAANRAPAVQERALPPQQAKGSPMGKVGREEAAAMRADPDGPDNIHHLGEPCQTSEACDALFKSEMRWENPITYATNIVRSLVHGNVSKQPGFLAKHMDKSSHAMPDGSLQLIVDEGPNGNGAMPNAMMTAKAENRNFRFVKDESIAMAVAKERAAHGRPFKELRISAHGSPGQLYGAGAWGTPIEDVIKGISPHMAPGATVNMESCNVAQTQDAREDLQVLANKYNLVIRANGDLGHSADGGLARRHAYVFTPNPKGLTELSQTRHAQEMAEIIRRTRDIGAN
jgi:hypothetical protein